MLRKEQGQTRPTGTLDLERLNLHLACQEVIRKWRNHFEITADPEFFFGLWYLSPLLTSPKLNPRTSRTIV